MARAFGHCYRHSFAGRRIFYGRGLGLNGLDGISAQQLSDAIGAVYDCAIDPDRWPATCRAIAALCESSAGGICVHDLKQVQNDQLFVFGYRPEFLDALGLQFAESPMAAADIVSNLGDVNTLSIEMRNVDGSRFRREVLEPFGLTDMIWFPALRTGGRMASLHASRSEPQPNYQQQDLRLFKLLAPHVCRALTISDLLDIRALRSEMLERTLDGLVTGVYLTARDGHVVYMNAAAERQVKAGDAVRVTNNRLSPVDPDARLALKASIEASNRTNLSPAWNGHSMALPGNAGPGHVATLLPIESGFRSGLLAPFSASVAIFVQDPVHAPPMPGEAFARIHGLTGGELRVLLAISQGLGGLDSAEMLGISEATVRTHLQRIFAKTGTTKQADLLYLLQRSTPPIQAQVPMH